MSFLTLIGKTLIGKYRWHIVAAFILLPLIVFVIWFSIYAAYMKNEPSFAEAKKTLLLIRQGSLKPSHSGSVSTPDRMTYVTHASNGALTVLWPYNLAHDDNYFEGLLFSDTVLTTDKVTALAPTRYPTANKAWMTHLTVDRRISEHWYHVQGEMYK